MDRLTDVQTEKEVALDGIIRSSEKSQHQGATLVSGGSIAVEKAQVQDGIVKSGVKAQHQGATLVSGGSIAVEKEARQDGILKSAAKSQHQGSGFASMGSIAVEKEGKQDGIVKSGVKAQHQGATLVSGGSIATEKEVRLDGIVRGGGPVNTGPISNSADEIKQKIAEKIQGNHDPALENAVKTWMSAALGKPIGDNFQEELSDGQLLCALMNLVYPKSIPKVQKGKMAFHKRENISSFCKQLETRQFPVTFQPEDIIDGTNMPKVVQVLSDVCRTGKRRCVFRS
jgi:hypothetical protein